MKKIIISAIAAVMICLSASAAEVILTTMAITAKNGDVVELQFIDEPIATFTDENVTFTDINEHTLVYPMADVEKITFKSTAHSAIEEIADDAAARFSIFVTKTAVTVDGMEAGSALNVYNLAGQLVASATADAAGHAEASTESLGAGVYVVALPGHSFKFVK